MDVIASDANGSPDGGSGAATPAGPALPRSPGTDRLLGPDVTRGIALIGVVVMNYHGYLNGSGARAHPGSWFPQRLFDTTQGVLSTRFAATFVTVAGIGVTLLTRRSVASGDRAMQRADRWRLVRRGLLLYSFGFVLNWMWSGTILFYYGALFALAALLFTLRSRVLLVIAGFAAVAAAGIRWWAAIRVRDGHDVTWLLAPQYLTSRSPRGLLFQTFINGTHPVLPWIAFLCVGMVLGRHLTTMRRNILIPAGLALTGITYLVNHLVTTATTDPVVEKVFSTRWPDRGLLYTLGCAGTSVAAYCVVSWIAERFASNRVIDALAITGRTTLSIYVLHVLVFNLFVRWWGLIGPTGLDASLGFAVGFWLCAIGLAVWWERLAGQGPLERWYRSFGG